MFELFVLGISIVGNALLGIAVARANWDKPANRLFLALVVTTIVWLIATYEAVHVGPSLGIILVRLTMFLATLQILFLFFFVHSFSESLEQLTARRVAACSAAAIAVGALALSPYMFTGLKSGSPTPGPAIVVFLLFAATLVGSALYTLFTKMSRSKGIMRRQLRYLTFGIVMTFGLIALFNLLSVVFFKNAHFISLTPAYTLILIGAISYAIVAHHLFDIRIIVRRAVIYTMLLTALFASYSAIVFLFAQLLPLVNVSSGLVPNFIASLIVGFSLDPMRRWLQDRTERFLFKKEYEEQAVLKELTQKLNNVIGLDDALEALMQSLVKAMHLRHAVSFVFQHGENKSTAISRIKQIGYASSAKLMLDEKDFTVEFFASSPDILIVDDLEHELESEQRLLKRKLSTGTTEEQAALVREHAVKRAVLKKLRSVDAAVAVPLHIGLQPIGLILLSSKLSQEMFSREDIALIDIVGSQAVSSIQKARLFEGDQMKTEFVSIASHELLTPVAAMEGYLSMLLDENLGTIDDQARQYLTKVYTSAKRLSALVKDLLSVSRLEAGRVKVAPQSIDLEKVLADIVEQLSFSAKAKSLEIRCIAPKSPLPPAYADPDRLIEVLLNLIGNAIKYTPSGSVTISTSLHSGMIKVDIKDTGLGMSHEEQAHLFEKFYRVYSEDTANITGTGLGLYITKSVVEKLGGKIGVKSLPGAGSTFSFTLPVFKVEQSTMS